MGLGRERGYGAGARARAGGWGAVGPHLFQNAWAWPRKKVVVKVVSVRRCTQPCESASSVAKSGCSAGGEGSHRAEGTRRRAAPIW